MPFGAYNTTKLYLKEIKTIIRPDTTTSYHAPTMIYNCFDFHQKATDVEKVENYHEKLVNDQ